MELRRQATTDSHLPAAHFKKKKKKETNWGFFNF